MTKSRLSILAFRRLRAGRQSVAGLLLLVAMIFDTVNCAAGSDPVVSHHLGAFYEAFLGRKPSDSESREVTAEFIRYHAGKGRGSAAIDEVARRFGSYAKVFREQKGRPADLALRHGLIQVNYFDPELQNTTSLRLLTEPDPVRVFGSRSKRLMTERDVVALANLQYFSASQDEPRHRELSRQQIDDLAIAVHRHLESRLMPRFSTEAAELWAGIQREWPKLSAAQKRQVRMYAANRAEVPLDDYKLYGKLLDLSDAAAALRKVEDNTSTMIQIQGEGHIVDAFIRGVTQ